MQAPLMVAYTTAFICYFFTLVFSFLKMRGAENCIASIALAANGAAIIFIVKLSGHLPVFKLFESFLLLTFILGALGLLFSKPEESLPNIRMWVWIEVLVILSVTLLCPNKPSLVQYNNSYIFMALFHWLRIISCAMMLFSSTHFIQFRIQEKIQSPSAKYHLKQGRNFLLLSTIIFLGSEYAGSIWSLNGWGDFWRWNEGFYQSTLIIICLMLVFHIPGKSSQSEKIKALLGGICGFFALTLIATRCLL